MDIRTTDTPRSNQILDGDTQPGSQDTFESDVSLAPVHPLPSARANPAAELMAMLDRMQSIARQALTDPSAISDNRDAIINVIEKLMLMLAKEERKAKHDRFDAKMSKLVDRIQKMLSAAEQTLKAGREELDAIRDRAGFQLGFALLAVVIIAVAIAAAVATGGAAALVVGAALAALMPVIGSASGELAAKDNIEQKQLHNEQAADLNAIAAEVEKLMENEGELSAEAKELLRKLLEILMKVFDKLNASRRKATEGMGS